MPGFVVVGGGATGSFYVRQLHRAVDAGRLHTRRIRVLDRDPACRASALPGVEVVAGEWPEALDRALATAGAGEHVVPHHFAPHLLLGWLERQLEARRIPTARVGGLGPRGLPFEALNRDGDRALSYASWPCPPACIEPLLCPHTRGPRDWSLARDLEAPRAGEPFAERVVFRCLHLVYGVGTVPVSELLAACDRLATAAGGGPAEALVATSSHCHGLATRIRVG